MFLTLDLKIIRDLDSEFDAALKVVEKIKPRIDTIKFNLEFVAISQER